MRLKKLIFVCLTIMVSCTPVTPLGIASPTNSPKIIPTIPSSTNTTVITVTKTLLPTDLQRTPDPTEMNIDQWESTSPDGKWIARGTYASPKSESDLGVDHILLFLENTSEKIQWTAIDMWREIGLGFTYPQPVKWSQDGGYFYFTNTPVVEGCKALPVNGSDLLRVDLLTGDVREIIPGIAFWISLSPDEDMLAYIKQISSNLWVHHLNTGNEKEIAIDPGVDFDAGNIVWSPNGQLLALTLANRPCAGDYTGSGIFAQSTSILIVDIATLEVRKITDGDKRRLVTVKWFEADKIELEDPIGISWILDAINGEINQK